MEENRFLRVYQEYKKEKEEKEQEYKRGKEDFNKNYDNRFECLKESRPDIKEVNRFECLRDKSIRKHDIRVINFDDMNKFNCLIDKNTKTDIKEEKVHYLPRHSPLETNIHFPSITSNNSIRTSNKLKEMIVNPILVKDERRTMTMIAFKDGKVSVRDMYEDGSDVLTTPVTIIKKPVYSSWKSVITKDDSQIHYDIEYK